MSRMKLGYIVKVSADYSKWDNAAKVLTPYFKVIEGFDSENARWQTLMDYMPSMRGFFYIPIVFTDRMAMNIIKELKEIYVRAEYEEYDFMNEIPIEGTAVNLQILYSHVQNFTVGVYGVNSGDNEIVRYLKGIFEMESALLTIRKCKNDLGKRIQRTENRVERMPKHQIQEIKVDSVGTYVGIAILTAIIASIVSPFALALLFDALEITREQVGGGIEVLWELGIKIGIGIGVLTFVCGLLKRKKEELENEKMRKRIDDSKKDELKVNNGNRSLIRKLDHCENKVKDVLNQLYEADIISQEYRGLIPVAEFIDYMTFENGDIERLSGENGAYELYEHNLEKRAICRNLDMIEENVSGWASNQPTTCIAIRKARNLAANVTKQGELDKFINQIALNCDLILEDFGKYERYLSSYK